MQRAATLMLNEQSKILTSTEKPTTSKADPRGGAPIGAGGVMTPPLFEAKGVGGT